jgi:small subunit ribosomal protein S6e
MAEFKLVISDSKTGKSYQKEAKDDSAKPFLGLKIGDKVKGEAIDLTGYEFEITGGSDYCGFPMRKDVPGQGRKRIICVQGIGFTKIGRGIKQRKTVCGNTIYAKTAQINLKIIKYGSKPLAPENAEGEKKAE